MNETQRRITEDMLRNRGTWPQQSHLCMKQGQPLGGVGKCGVMLRHECDADGGMYVVRNHPDGEHMYGGAFAEEFWSIGELIRAGWVVD